ncbi:membrane protease subunit, stomatin/prohibitin [Oleiphilus messinensis]|uniref:Membrane protease subunit, stomatin/prohibitin n=1 Tax=Oleiphilus messinensis TaxID=141451 RepID=A0A1Y0IHC0_9GAMM|nr:slipin family protein [Oleiphilus messinensis]ARU59246.1 membrane protease subunit, stomatin/prohibitin [Oleiphilus messinensis]
MFGMTRKVLVADNERVLMYRERQFQQVLTPGTYRFWDMGQKLSFFSVAVTRSGITHELLDVLLQKEEFANHVDSVMMQENEVGVVYLDNKIQQLLQPGERLVTWKDSLNLEVKVFSLDVLQPIAEPMLSHLLRAGMNRTARAETILNALVPDGYVGLLYENGKWIQTLKPGRYGYWLFNRDLQVQLYDLKLQMVEISGQEILTKDRVSLRVNLNAVYQLVDVEVAAQKLKNVGDYIYKRLQLALREVIGTRTLDELLSDKNVVSSVIYDECHASLKDYGIFLDRVGVKDIILPGEMKEILNQVVQAQKAAEANLIKRREETAATRSLSNTAKMMENNATLLRLKELETLEKVVEKIDHISVYGGLDSVMNDMVRLTGKAPTAVKN